ncbi:MAG: hypothetical protein CO129_08010 [Ignavibacteriales bacterium CG_4_9_14_3_um_filter_34_10]|nr:MAG: hypothetical protein CO129_08010 [Ignavibacteriales bacterium CG_4_9_14_3_um_filter_34_10]
MIIVELIYNLSVLVAVSILSGFVDFRFSRDKKQGQIIQGVLFGIVSIIGMAYPFVLTEGIIFDGRSIVLSLCALFFGPLAGLISAVIAGTYRLYLGGGGWLMGILVISSSYLIGVYFNLRRKKNRIEKISKLELYVFGLIVHAVMLVFVLALPSKSIMEAYKIISFTVIGIYPIISLIIGKILLDQELKSNLLSKLAENESLYRTTLYSIGDAVITTDKKGFVKNMNSVAESLTGYKEAEVQGKYLSDIFNIINEETRLKVENPVEKVLQQKKVISLANHTVLINKHGVEIPIADSGAPISNENDEIVGVVLVFRDQIKERQAKKLLVESEKRFRLLYENAPIAYQSLDQNANIIEVNNAWMGMLGFQRDEVLGHNIAEFIVEKDIPLLMEKFPKFLETGEVCCAEFNLKTKSNEIVTVSVDGRIGFSVDGKFRQTHCVLHNITEQRKYQNAIKKKSEGLASLLKISLNLVETLDKKQVLQNIVDNAVDLLKLDSGSIYMLRENTLILEATYPELPADFLDEFKLALLHEHPQILKAVSTKNILIFEDVSQTQFSPKEDVIIKARNLQSLIYLPLIVEKRVLGILILGTIGRTYQYSDDEISLCRTLSSFAAITLENSILFENINLNLAELEITLDEKKKAESSLKESEEKFRNLSENANDLIYRYDFFPVRGFTYVSPSSTRIVGYTPEEHYADPNLGFKLIHPADLGILNELHAGKDFYDKPLILRWIRKDGKIIWTEQKNVPVFDKLGKMIAIEGISRDITEQKNAEIIQQIQYNIADGIIKSENINEFLELVRSELSKFIDSKNFFVAFYDEATGMMKSDIDRDEKDEIETWPAEKSISGYIVKTGKSLMLSRDEILELERKGEIELIGTLPEIWLGAPLKTDGKTFGAIVVQNYDKKNAYDLAGLEFLELIASQISFYMEKKKAELELVLRENRYRQLFTLSPSGILLEDLHGNILDMNDSFCYSVGYSREELLGKNINFLASSDLEPDIESNIQKLVSGKILEHSVRNLRKDGSVCWLELRESLIELPNGEKGIIVISNDITEKKEAEDALKSSEELFRTLAETTSTAIFVYQGRKFVYSNKAAQKISGYSEEEFLQKDFWDFIHFDFRDMVKERGIARLRGEKVPDNYEFKIICKDGSEKWLDFTAGMINWQGKLSAIGTAFDITPRKLYEESLRNSEMKLRSIFSAIPDIFLILDSEGTYIEIAPSHEHLLYLPKEQLLGKKISEVFEKEMADKFLHLINKTLQTRQAQQLDYQLVIDGKPTWFQATTVPFKENQVVYIATDITKRKKLENALKESEEKYRLISNLTSDYLFSTKLNKKGELELDWVSGSFEKITGYDLKNYKKVGGWRGLLHKDDAEKDLAVFNKLQNNEPISCEVRTYHKDGHIVWVRSYGYPIWDKSENRLVGIIGAVEDISESKKMMEELIIARDKAEKSDKLKSEFLAQMSHEIRSPLNIILNFVSLIREDVADKIDPDLATGFLSIDSAGRRIIRTIDLILNMSELQLGTYEIYKREFDIIEILKRITLEYRPTATVKGLNLIFSTDIKSQKIYTDEYAASQVISNLIDNAIKYTKEGSVETSAQIIQNKLTIAIKDTGIGISEEFLPTLFSPFTQEEHGYTRSYEGNGLGLALVKKYCDLIGADIKVESKKGKGTTFTLAFSI